MFTLRVGPSGTSNPFINRLAFFASLCVINSMMAWPLFFPWESFGNSIPTISPNGSKNWEISVFDFVSRVPVSPPTKILLFCSRLTGTVPLFTARVLAIVLVRSFWLKIKNKFYDLNALTFYICWLKPIYSSQLMMPISWLSVLEVVIPRDSLPSKLTQMCKTQHMQF